MTNLIEIYWQVKRHARDFSDEFENKNRPKLGVFILKLPNLHQLKSDQFFMSSPSQPRVPLCWSPVLNDGSSDLKYWFPMRRQIYCAQTPAHEWKLIPNPAENKPLKYKAKCRHWQQKKGIKAYERTSRSKNRKRKKKLIKM